MMAAPRPFKSRTGARPLPALIPLALALVTMISAAPPATATPLEITDTGDGRFADDDMLRFINPLIGSTNGGNVFAGRRGRMG